ncbi:MAG: hypothetical protein D6744_19010 [Planctomycetota bacterium]|nr:MAG: hypothetical protein D6744_19010 [Planctomycetota bacterium]
MKRIIPIVIVASALVGTAVSRTLVLKNGSFEDFDPNTGIPISWIEFSNTLVSTDVVADGAVSILADFANGAFAGAFQDTVSVSGNTRVFQRCLALHPSSDPIPPGGAGTPPTAGIKLEFFPPQGIDPAPPEENLAFDANSPVDVWETVSLNTVVPADTTAARVVLISFEETDPNGNPIQPINGPVYVDSVSLSIDGGANALVNPSFESTLSGNWNSFGSGGSGAIRNQFEVPADDGVAVLKIGGDFTAGATQEVSVSAGQTFDLSAKFRSRSTGTPPNGGPYQHPAARAGVKVEWIVGSVPQPNIDIVPNANPISGTTNAIDSTDPTDVWIPLTIDYTMPAGSAALLRATILNGFGTGSGKVYYDSYEMVLTNVFDGSDTDADGDEDLHDMALLQRAYSGSGGGLKFGGLVFDHDEDDDVDDSDVSFTLSRMTGPATP